MKRYLIEITNNRTKMRAVTLYDLLDFRVSNDKYNVEYKVLGRETPTGVKSKLVGNYKYFENVNYIPMRAVAKLILLDCETEADAIQYFEDNKLRFKNMSLTEYRAL